jgi:hypothetical protein
MTDSDIKEIKESNKHNNLFFLQYYSFENYLYHPENLKTTQKYYDDYEIDIFNEVKKKIKYEVFPKLDSIRKGYDLLKPNFGVITEKRYKKVIEQGTIEIMKSIESDDFELIYQYLDIKKKCGDIKNKLNIDIKLSAKTGWFKQQIANILGIEQGSIRNRTSCES